MPAIEHLGDLLRLRAKTDPNGVAYTFLVGGEQPIAWSWSELESEAERVAEDLNRQGLQPGDRVLIALEEGLDFLAALFGCLLHGALAVPVHPPDPRRLARTLPRLEAVVADSTPRAVIGDVQIELPPPAPPVAGLAYLQYTSGSTAAPKGVQVSHANLLHQLRDFDHGYEHTGGTIVTWLPATHDLGLVYGRLMGLYRGIPTVFFDPAAFVQRPRRWLEALTRFRGTHSPAPNFGYALAARRVKDLYELDLSSVRLLLNGAEPIRSKDEAAFLERFMPVGLNPTALTHAMGMSEATAKICTEPLGRRPRFLRVDADALRENRIEPVSVGGVEVASNGSPQFDTQIHIVDPHTRAELGEGRVGELWVCGDTVAGGYWNQPDHPDFEGRLHDRDHLRTGDLGFLHEGELYLVGRLKDVLIVHGENHHAPDLEASVESCHPAVRRGGSAAFSTMDEGVGVVAEVQPDADAKSVFTAIRTALAAHGLQPAALGLLPPRTLPRTTSGKLKRRATAAAFEEGSLALLHRWEPVRTGQGTSIHAEAARALGLDPSDLQGNVPLKDLGLDSITAVEIVERVARRLGRNMPGTLLFDHPTLDALHTWLNQPDDDVDRMSEAEAEAALRAELEDL